jgi:hypothetical protein
LLSILHQHPRGSFNGTLKRFLRSVLSAKDRGP